MRAYVVTLSFHGCRIRLPVIARSWALASRMAVESIGRMPRGLTCRRVRQ